MSRLFTFGCSFTQYLWPTWADILGSRFDHHQNWAECGAGNQFIVNSLVECHHKNQISDSDTVGIMWTNVSRLDTYKNRRWHTPGNIYTQPYYSKDIVDFLFDTRGYYIRDLASIYLAHQLLEKIGCRYYMFSMVDMRNHLQYEPNDAWHHISDVLSYYQHTLDNIRPSVHQVVFDYDWYSRPFMMETQMSKLKEHYEKLAGPDWPEFEKAFDNDTLKTLDKKTVKEMFNLNKWDWRKMFHVSRRVDPHPTPLEHLEYLSKVLPEEPISYETYEIVREIDGLIHTQETIDSPLMRKFMKSNPPKRW